MKLARQTKLSQLPILQFLLLIITSLTIIEPLTQCTRHGRSGFYYDNGENQTVAHQFASPRQRRALARNILKLLDLPIRSTRSTTKIQLDVPASRFIRDVYRNALGKQEDVLFKFTEAELKTIENSEVIISYSALSKVEEHSKTTLEFDISETPKFSDAFNSELHVYVKPSNESIWKISVFDSQGFINSTNVTNEGWIKLTTGNVLRNWLNCSDCERELHLSVVSLENDINDSEILTFDDPQKQAFLVAYFVKQHPGPSTQFTVPNVRVDRTSKTKVPKNYLNNPYANVKDNPRRRKTGCRLHSLHVRFRELDFDKYIVEPEGYDAGYCQGDCRFPLTAHMNATNHALVQTLVNFLRSNFPWKVACAPKEYEDLSVIYSKNKNEFVYKKYQQMIVRSCGCC